MSFATGISLPNSELSSFRLPFRRVVGAFPFLYLTPQSLIKVGSVQYSEQITTFHKSVFRFMLSFARGWFGFRSTEQAAGARLKRGFTRVLQFSGAMTCLSSSFSAFFYRGGLSPAPHFFQSFTACNPCYKRVVKVSPLVNITVMILTLLLI